MALRLFKSMRPAVFSLAFASTSTSLAEIIPARLFPGLALMFSQFLQKARACCLAVASRIIGHTPISQPTPEKAVNASYKLWQDLDGDFQYPLAFSESSRPALPLGTTVATFLGLGIRGHPSSGHSRYHVFPPLLPFPFTVIPGLAAEFTKAKAFRPQPSRSSGIQLRPLISGLEIIQYGVEAVLRVLNPHGVDEGAPSSSAPCSRQANDRPEIWLKPLPQGAHLLAHAGNIPSGADPVIPQVPQPSSHTYPAIRSWRAHVEKPPHRDG